MLNRKTTKIRNLYIINSFEATKLLKMYDITKFLYDIFTRYNIFLVILHRNSKYYEKDTVIHLIFLLHEDT